MIKAAFYLNNFVPKASFDASALPVSNPGIGGTEYEELLMAYLLQCRDNGIEVKLFSNSCEKIKGIENIERVDSVSEAVTRCNEQSIDYLIICHDRQMVKSRSLDIPSPYTKIIVWCHIFCTAEELDYFADNASVWKLVCVGKEQRDLFIDHRSFAKSEYIYNAFSVAPERFANIQPERKNIVTYVGLLHSIKGFHWLADEWKKVLRAVPDAELYVIGSGKLYGWNEKMGPLQIAEEKYEKRITQPLSEGGKLLPGVHFLGIMGEEKYDILSKSKVGVANPTGNTETFCISGVEMQAMGAKLVMGSCPGAMDTVVNGTVVKKKGHLADAIIAALKSRPSDHQKVLKEINARFSPEVVVQRWETLIKEGKLPSERIIHRAYRFKWLKILSRDLFPDSRRIPTVERYLLAVEHRYGRNWAKYKYHSEKKAK